MKYRYYVKGRYMSHRKKALNWEQVRDRIDLGATGEKVSGSDPAAAPLGTDDEAAGVPSEPMEDEIERNSAVR